MLKNLHEQVNNGRNTGGDAWRNPSNKVMRGLPESYRMEGSGEQLFTPENVRIAERYAERWRDSDAGRAWAKKNAEFPEWQRRRDPEHAPQNSDGRNGSGSDSRNASSDGNHTDLYDFAERRIADMDPDNLFPVGIEYTPPARGTWTIAHTPMLVPGLHEIYVCPDGCLRGVVMSAEEFRGLDRFHVIEFREPDLYNGTLETKIIDGATRVIQQIREEKGQYPEAVMVTTSCIHDLMGLDRDMVYREIQDRFPTVDIVQGWMNCTMRMSYLHYEQVQWRQNYAALHPREKDPKSVNIIGASFVLDRESELVRMLEDGGFTVRDLPLCRTYEEFQEMASSSLNIWNWVMGMESCRDMEERLNIPQLHMPCPWTYAEIRRQLTELHDVTGAPLPDFDALEQRAEESLAEAHKIIGDTEIRLDGVSAMLPFQLAELLLDHGFNVTEVYADAVMAEDKDAFRRLAENHPDLKVSAMINFRLRMRPRDAAEAVPADADGCQLLAIGQRTAYFTDTPNFVDMIQNNGWYGYTGICRLADAMTDAFLNPKDGAAMIQIKARGCNE